MKGVSLFAPRRPLVAESEPNSVKASAPPKRARTRGSSATKKQKEEESLKEASLRPNGEPAASGAPDTKASGSTEKATHSYAREAAALLLLASALYVTLALASFRGDPMRVEVTGADWVGPVGAVLAGGLVEAVGVCSWLVPFDLALLASPLLHGKRAKVSVARISGDLVVLVVIAALLHVAFPASTAFGAMPLGGAAGELFGEVMRALFSTVGSYIVGLTIVSLILISRAAFSIIEWTQRAERKARALRERGEGGLRALAGAWDQARAIDEKRREDERRENEPLITEACDDAIILALGDDSPSSFPKVKPLAPIAVVSGAGASPRALLASDAPTPTPPVAISPLSAQSSKKRGRKKNGGDAPDEPSILESSEPMLDIAPSAAQALIISTPAVDGSEDSASSDASAVTDAAVEPPTPSAPHTTASRIALEEPAPVVEKTTSRSEKPAFAGDEHRKASDQIPAREKSTPAPALRIVDTSAALKAEKPAEIIKIVPAFGEGFRLPSPDLLELGAVGRMPLDEEQLKQTAVQLEKVLADYGVNGKVEEIHPGPTVTTFEVTPAAGTKVSKVAGLADDLALGLSRKVRIVAPIPGKNRIGFEIPNDRRLPVVMRELIEDKRFLEMKAPLPCVLGRDIIGAPFFADLASMPHVIVAGATGAGKSVGLNVMLVSLLYRRTPAELRLLMIDPKVVELAPFDGIPHMLLPVVTDMKQASNALKWAVDEMERRYQLFANAGTRNISTYNAWAERVRKGEIKAPKKALPQKVTAIAPDGTDVEVAAAADGSDAELPETLPAIVIVVDEFADLMMQQGKEVEASVARLAQKARAAGMHVILATQRPSVDVITGMIKANFPTRIAFRVAQKVDSRTILDEQGAEHLLGKGDMLVKMNGSNETRRVQCPFCSEEEVQRVTDFLRLQGTPVYDESILRPRDEEGDAGDAGDDALDPMYDAALRIVADTRRCSTSWLQRKLGIGYNRAAKIVEAMEKRGVVGPANGAKDREVLIGSI